MVWRHIRHCPSGCMELSKAWYNGTWHFVHCILDVLWRFLLLHALHFLHWHVRAHIIQPQFIRYSVNGLLSTRWPFLFFIYKVGRLCHSPFPGAEVIYQVTCKHRAAMQGGHRVEHSVIFGVYFKGICNGRVNQKIKYSHPPSFTTTWLLQDIIRHVYVPLFWSNLSTPPILLVYYRIPMGHETSDLEPSFCVLLHIVFWRGW